MSVSVVIPAHNRLEHIGKAVHFLNHWQNYEKSEMEIIISDDNSSEDIESYVEDLSKSSEIAIKFTSFKQNDGKPHIFRLAQARNAGCKLATKKMLLIMDCDRILSPNYIKNLEAIAASTLCAIGGKTIYLSLFPHEIPNDADESFFNRPELVLENDRSSVLFKKDINDITRDSWHSLYGGGVMIQREFFEKIGGYNEEYIGYGCEDCEFDRRIRRNKGRLYLTNVLMYHMNHPTFNHVNVDEFVSHYGKQPYDLTKENISRYYDSMTPEESSCL